MNESKSSQTENDAKTRVERLFQFVRAFTNSRHPLQRRLADQPAATLQIAFSDLPTTSEWVEPWTGSEEDRGWLLRVRLRALNPSPSPPAGLRDWLLPGWEKYTESARHVDERTMRCANGETTTTRFADDIARTAAWDEWTKRRDPWVREQQRHEPTKHLFSKLQAVRAELQKQSEQVELVLGVGHLRCKIDGKEYSHPLILKPVGIEFDARSNCFTLTETDRPTELYAELLAELNIDLAPAGSWRDELQSGHPMDSQTAILVEAIGDWLRNQPNVEGTELALAPLVFLRDRGGWPARAATAVLEDLSQKSAEDLPQYLLRLVGRAPADSSQESTRPPIDFVANEDAEILFALPANLEQLQLARQIERKDVVLVQGPPGTGKTHAIANLLGHLLSQGKRVLVTSHSSKALRVLREKVPSSIQSLCVSVLDEATRSRRELEEAVQSIATHMQQGVESLAEVERQLTVGRTALLEQIRLVRASQRLCVRREYEPIVVAGDSIEPSRAARVVRAGQDGDAWIPGPLQEIELGKPCPLSVDEVRWLYESQARVAPSDEVQFRVGLPKPESLPTPVAFRSLIASLKGNEAEARNIANPIWAELDVPHDRLTACVTAAVAALAALRRIEQPGPWLTAMVEIGADGGELPMEWQEIREFASRLQKGYARSQSLLLDNDPALPAALCTRESIQHLREMKLHVAQGGGLSPLQLPIKALAQGHWKRLLKHARCNAEMPSRESHFDALVLHVELHIARTRLQRRWERQVQSLGGPPLPDDRPEKAAHDWQPYLLEALGWFSRHWSPLAKMASTIGKPWVEVEARVPPQPGRFPRIARARLLLEKHLLPEWSCILAHHKAKAIRGELAETQGRLQADFPQAPASSVVAGLVEALSVFDIAAYERAFAELQRLQELETVHRRRDGLLVKVEQGAKSWHFALRARGPGHDVSLPVACDPATAWRWRQLNDALVLRSKLDADAINEQLRLLTFALETATRDLITARCWARQITSGERFRQHLVGWLDSMRRIGQGTGRNAEHYRRQAREQLKQGQRAVPVWIMPLAEVFRSLTVQEGRFDVVIVDEASQAGLGGLLAAYLGRKVVVVGDHEQVSPDAVGDDLAVSQALQQQYLEGFPNAALYDGKLSLYDLGRQTASGMLSLSEHFRCVPAIIGFSNRLSYGGKIKPLRDSTSSPLRAVVPHRVAGSRDGRQKINREEAQEAVSLIGAMCEQAAYDGHSIGVISLLGDDQAKLIETLLRRHLPAKEIEARKIMCGNAAQFQGDERDVILLSMVDSNEGDGPLRKVGEGANELYKKRYNVAGSRAQNQMWVLHSMDYSTDLKPDDLRRDLLEYAYVDGQMQGAGGAVVRTESEFERLVLQAIAARGYQVHTQYPVGYYRIDMVVGDANGRLAVECDGERWHSGAEKIAEDMARQAILERLGWRFHRIRGSQYFRDPAQSLLSLWERLEQLGIRPCPPVELPSQGADIHEALLRTALTLRNAWFPRSLFADHQGQVLVSAQPSG